jgi:Hydantoinase/oxoprolinase N-terminal region
MRHLAVDVGGTFTDICLFDDQEGATRVAKVSSTRDPIDAVFEGIGEMDVALGEISLFSYGTTVATKSLITREFPRAAMVTTRGFRDVIEIRRHGVILDWGTGELLPKSTEGFRAMLERRVVPHWKKDRERVEERDMDEPRNVPFGELGWTDDAPGIRAREAQVGASVGPPSSTGKGSSEKNGARKATAGTSSRARSNTSSMTAANP